LVATAHWEEEAFTFSSGTAPGMIHDYSGFPAHTYQVRYPASGAPELAAFAADLLARRGIAARLDAERGFDHGTFVPLHVMWPDADVPVVQMSIRHDLDPAAHLAAGAALAELRDAGVLAIGSGLSYHNLARFGPAGRASSATLDSWLHETKTAPEHTQRALRLEAWASAPTARLAHPREEHLLPLHIAVGAAGDDRGTCAYREEGFLGG
jgi:aromatic ring-opening dioxygenase catalytic subunit (LigB family)